MDTLELLQKCHGFQWDDGNALKNWHKHLVEQSECEQVFFNQPLLMAEDVTHSQQESRFFALGQTNDDRRLFVVFTIRDHLIRVISARDMSKKERKVYEQA